LYSIVNDPELGVTSIELPPRSLKFAPGTTITTEFAVQTELVTVKVAAVASEREAAFVLTTPATWFKVTPPVLEPLSATAAVLATSSLTALSKVATPVTSKVPDRFKFVEDKVPEAVALAKVFHSEPVYIKQRVSVALSRVAIAESAGLLTVIALDPEADLSMVKRVPACSA
tara:strand:- start:1571 stop:2086 length:516 start_codon:yes stop_codon:yes gene_type:complete